MTTAMFPSIVPEAVVNELNQLGVEASCYNGDDAHEALARICCRMQHFLDNVRHIIDEGTKDGKEVRDLKELAMSTTKKELLAVVSGTFAYLVSDGERQEVVSEDLSEIRRCIQNVLDTQRREEGSAHSISREQADYIEAQVAKRINSTITVRPITTSVKSLREEAA